MCIVHKTVEPANFLTWPKAKLNFTTWLYLPFLICMLFWGWGGVGKHSEIENCMYFSPKMVALYIERFLHIRAHTDGMHSLKRTWCVKFCLHGWCQTQLMWYSCFRIFCGLKIQFNYLINPTFNYWCFKYFSNVLADGYRRSLFLLRGSREIL